MVKKELKMNKLAIILILAVCLLIFSGCSATTPVKAAPPVENLAPQITALTAKIDAQQKVIDNLTKRLDADEKVLQTAANLSLRMDSLEGRANIANSYISDLQKNNTVANAKYAADTVKVMKPTMDQLNIAMGSYNAMSNSVLNHEARIKTLEAKP
jgi:PBP1b-binding outer membrane lipoprotein LpoB